MFQGFDIISGPLLGTFLFHQGVKKAVIVVDDFLHVHLSHSTFSPSALTSARADLRVSRYRHQHRNIQDRAPVTLLPTPSRTTPIVGHRSVFYQELSQYAVAYPMWSLSLSPGETIQRMIPAIRGPVASVGKVLGNRTTLYKYLNHRLLVVLTELPSSPGLGSGSGSPQTCGIDLVDTTKGSVVYRASVHSSSGSCGVKASLSENWLVYHYYEKDAEATGYRMVSVEL